MVAKAVGGSFKLFTLAPKTVREMTQPLKETQKNGDTKKSKRTNKHTKHKPRLSNRQTETDGDGCTDGNSMTEEVYNANVNCASTLRRLDFRSSSVKAVWKRFYIAKTRLS